MQKNILLRLFLLVLSISSFVFCLDKVTADRSEDLFSELDTGKLTLRFLNALSGEGLAGARVVINGVGDFMSDTEGKVLFAVPEDRSYDVTISKPGFITSVFKIEITAGTMVYNRFSVSPDLKLGHIRIVLDWGAKPKDLDAHLVKKGEYHISYRKQKNYADGVAMLDRDDKNGHGPETITITHLDENADYEYYIHDYTNRKKKETSKLSKSKAWVKIFGQEGLLHIYKVPEDMMGKKWNVFSITNGKISIINTME
ncbi:MAG: carboxypeptidase regulatory-like domain-containing protein [Fibrobacteria bacterium]|nr:carboxypeptidase regulatory-like domain-containing protein [Fibrobacteria bacterium]